MTPVQEAVRLRRQDPEYRAKMLEAKRLRYQQDPEYRAKIQETQRLYNQRKKLAKQQAANG